LCHGERVDLTKVDRMTLTILHKGPLPVHWCMTVLTATTTEPPLISKPILPAGTLLDEIGQSTLHEWEGKSQNADEVTRRLHSQLAAVPEQEFPALFSRWGGWAERRVDPSGYFRTHHDGKRWWLVDPDGCYFWSTGLDCVRVDTAANIAGLESALTWLPEAEGTFSDAYETRTETTMVNYLAANLIRAFGQDSWYENWSQIVLAEMRRLRFNTVANWSDWRIASQAGFPYVRPLGQVSNQIPLIYRDFPDVFHPDFPQAAKEFAESLRETVSDPAMIGYFLMNEPTWGFAQETPAAGMLFNTPECYTRQALADFLRKKYGGDEALASAWGMPITLSSTSAGEWVYTLTAAAQADLAAFSAVMVERFFGELSRACRQVDPNHLNLGIRYYTIPPEWALPGMRHFDVFSMNCYKKKITADEMAQVNQMLNQPILVGEWHFGALDVGLPASGIGHVTNQEGRGKAYRIYLEDAAVKPWCVGVHYFTIYDQSALGRFDGENYNIGFLDVCHRPYPKLAEAARTSHERMYALASGQLAPFTEEPDYLPLLFL
jgi:hypothetical protein